MCGISGVFAFNMIGGMYMINLQAANEALAHRGPDAARLFNDEKVGLGHRRLSIIDLSAVAHQPMTDESENYTIVFNGEIFNYQSLRKELENQGVQFKSQSDTEVLLHLYIQYKEQCLNKLQGFFAFAIYDKANETLFVARDRMGIKPLLYYFDEDKFLFSSELNSLLAFNLPKRIDYHSIALYFQLHYIPSPHTAFQDIYKLPPAHYAIIKKKSLEIHPYYEVGKAITTHYQPYLQSYDKAQRHLVELLEDAVKSRLIADVPVGTFLSGGIDSSVVATIAAGFHKNIQSFSIGYKDEPFFDETHYAELVAKKIGTAHTVFKLSNDDIFEAVQELLGFFGEPFADSSAIPFYILSKKTRQKVTVALSGDGADEIFAGYNKYAGEYRIRHAGTVENLVQQFLPFLEKMPQSRNNPFANKVRQLVKMGKAMQLSPAERYWFLSCFTPPNTLNQLFSSEIQQRIQKSTIEQCQQQFTKHITGKDLNDMLLADCHLVLPNDMLHKVDSMSMANSLEVREPFMDYRVVDYAFALPEAYKIDGGMKKKILQDAFRHVLPKELYQRPKHGFEVPLMKGYQRELKSLIDSLLGEDFIREQGVFNPTYIKNLRQTIAQQGSYDQNHVWALLSFQHWWKRLDLSIVEPKREEE